MVTTLAADIQSTGSATVTSSAPSASLTHDSPSHLPPYVVVHLWKRTA